MTDLAVVIPWRDNGDPTRGRNFHHTLRYYLDLRLGPVIPIDDGQAPGSPFNRHAAYNRGLERTGTDVILWVEADTLIPADQIEQAATLAAQEPGLVIPFDTRLELTPAATERILQEPGYPATVTPDDVAHRLDNRSSIGAAGVTSRRTIQAAGRWPTGFDGWGYDDDAAEHAFARLAGPTRWVDGPSIHLWHPEAYKHLTPAQAEATERNRIRYHAMRAATDDQLRAMIRTP